jgi:hypothetical protein
MPRTAKTVSIRHLHAAVKTALEAARNKHPEFKIDPATPSNSLPIIIHPPWICGLPVPWPVDINNVVEFNNTFVAQLSKNTQISALAVDEKFEPAVYLSAGKASIGFVPSDAAVTE